jgi:5,5'-dehydrodivanillate O-demethylase oxygenase subunit
MADYRELFRTAPGTLGGQYMRLFWHPVLRSVDLKPGWAKPLQVMSEKFTLYRGESGTAHIVAFRCAHRGLQLSVGWVEGDCIRCRYHGWKYDGSGQCVDMPTEDESSAKSVRIRHYPTEEYLGFIFAYLGDGEPPPLPRYPDFETGEIWTETYERPCNFFNNLENDPVHIPFAHRESEIFRNRPIDIPEKVQAEESEWGITLYTTFSGNRLRINQFGWPNIRTFKAPDRDHLVWRVPIDDESHSSFQLDVMHVTSGELGELYKQRHAARTGKIGNSYKELGEAILRGELRIQDIEGDDKANLIWIQDYVTQVGIGTFADRVNERLIRSDSGVLMYRKIWEREVSALTQNKPLKQWTRPERLLKAYSYQGPQQSPNQTQAQR